MKTIALNLTDGYKVDHRRQYPDGTSYVFSNLTARKSRVEGSDGIIFFGLQYFIKRYLAEEFNQNFFNLPKDMAVKAYKRRIDNYLGPNQVGTEHIAALHDLGFLPLQIRAVPEGMFVPVGVPCLTIENTRDEFSWLTNYIETLLSTSIWLPCTSATTAYRYRKLMDGYADATGGDKAFVQWQGHDFSFRGMAGVEAAMMSGAGHLLSFTGTDTIPAIDFLEQYYFADSDKELIGGSVAASEHAVMCMGGQDDEIGTFKRMITEVYPSGIVSLVSDTWDFWKVVTEYLPQLKPIVMARDGKLVIRPDSGDPVKIICGDPDAPVGSPEYKGAVECLWETFGGTVNEKGHKQLDPHIGLIYGDSITYERCETILRKLATWGFASTNVVFGIGSYTYQMVTRDTYGFAVKATYGVVNGQAREIFKNPKTDDGTKRSLKGKFAVVEQDSKLVVSQDHVILSDVDLHDVYELYFVDGSIKCTQTLAEIRKRVQGV